MLEGHSRTEALIDENGGFLSLMLPNGYIIRKRRAIVHTRDTSCTEANNALPFAIINPKTFCGQGPVRLGTFTEMTTNNAAFYDVKANISETARRLDVSIASIFNTEYLFFCPSM
jgi:hypothetical protein